MDLVTKTNSLVQASYKLDLFEQRLVLLAIVEAREEKKLITSDSVIKVDVKRYAERFNIELKSAYSPLKKAVKSLFNRQFTYMAFEPQDDVPIIFTSRWVSKIGYKDGSVYLQFSPDIIPLITRLESEFTRYDLDKVAGMTSIYAVRIYEICSQWKSVGKFHISLNDLRFYLDLAHNELTRIDNLRRKVIDIAVVQINEFTELNLKYTPVKDGRSIIGFDFKFSLKKQKSIDVKRDPNTEDMFVKMTDAQRHLFANKMSEMPEMSKYSQGTESYQQFAVRIAEMLLQPERFRELRPLLEKAGFTP
jgi:plasmid replication initiation protein